MTGAGWPAHYEIRVDGVLDDRWAGWFGELQVGGEAGHTAIFGLIADQPALHGVLTTVCDLGLCLVSVRRLGPVENRDRMRHRANASETELSEEDNPE
ncbi:hypothetical protein [Nocardia nova]|uniref:hypothetical protein n=1 Tax=Nocardia nova TaxID=37330 RepID=UPI001895B244|nr:hypothetical protein [Nocardia nova]MBF6149598.1 hypothetical protein [Nocardia nova]